MKKLLYLLTLGYLILVLAGCGSPSPAASNSGTTNVSISKYTVATGAINPSANNPFTNNVSIASFGSPSTATLITLVKTATPAAGSTFTETISTSPTATYAAYQAASTINNITGKNGISSLAQVAAVYNNPFAGEEFLRQSEAQLLKQGGSFTKKSSALTGLNALGNATPDVVGAVNNFWVNRDLSGNPAMDVNVSATCAYVGTNAYIYVDNSVYNAASASVYNTLNMASISAAFDAIYTTDRATFGSEYKPGIDNDNHVTILISPAVNNYNNNGTLGYFWGKDEFAATIGTGTYTDHSNQREMFYVVDIPGPGGVTLLWGDAATTAINAKAGYAVLAHEFQHMINYYQKAIANNTLEDAWINEGLSMYAMQACGYGMPQGDAGTANWVNAYLASPEQTSLTSWVGTPYGMVYLYILYLVEQYGGGVGTPASQLMLKTMVGNNTSGIAQIESVTGAGTFGTVFKNWAMANLLDGLTTNNPAYNYTSINLNGGVYGGVTLTGIQTPYVFSNFPVGGGLPQPGWSAAYQIYNASTTPAALNISITSTAAQNNLEAVLIVR